ncbi:MAG: flagellar motor switch protein FliG [Anaerolineae bacterium]|nr:flagellar motor switch protein FliG [Anaerolineae bacterium]
MASSQTSSALASASAQMSGSRRAAVLLIMLGSELAAEVLKHCREDVMERVSLEMFSTPTAPPEDQKQVLQQAQKVILTREAEKQGGLQYVRDLLGRTMGKERAEEFLARLLDQNKTQSFSFLADADPAPVASVLNEEHPQTIALILSHLRPAQAARILSSLNPELQTDVAARIATIERITPDVVREVERNLQNKLSNTLLRDEAGSQQGGVDFLVQILNQSDRSLERQVLDALTEQNPELAQVVKNQMFIFEDIVQLDDRSIQRILRDVDQKDLILALRGVKPDVRERIMHNMSKRAAQLMEEEMAVMKPVRVSTVEAAQQRIVEVIRRLEESEEIAVSRGGQGDVLI